MSKKISLLGHRPLFIVADAKLSLGEGRAQIFLDIDRHDRIVDVGLTLENWDELKPIFDSYFKLCLGKTLKEALHNSWQDLGAIANSFFPYPMLMLRQAYIELRGGENNWMEQNNERPENLICRCFGVFKGQIEKVVLENPNPTLLTITDMTMAAGGCHSCKESIIELMESYKKLYGLNDLQEVGNGKDPRTRVGGMTPVELLLKVQSHLEKLNPSVSWELVRADGTEIQLKIISEDREDLRRDWELYLNKKMSLELSLLLLL